MKKFRIKHPAVIPYIPARLLRCMGKIIDENIGGIINDGDIFFKVLGTMQPVFF
ncbi:TPA: hypothetical protein ACPSKV_001569 [Legionella bozemanae]|uniref:hypothetical protein n=1 Tax=Legionella bozemanae TaxID=447 RepID=UPI000AF0692A|nr:hypothetical protein [Legionella bozemanae]